MSPAVYLFLRWVYARAGITSRAGSSNYQAVPHFPKQQAGPLAFMHSDSADTANGSDHYLIESQLEMSDYPTHHSSNGGSSSGSIGRDNRKGGHAM